MAKVDQRTEADPALDPFLALLEQDIETRPQSIEPVSSNWYMRAAALVEGIAVDLDSALPRDATARSRLKRARPRS